MRLEAIRLRNIGPFRDFSCDLSTLGDARLVAVTGANGAGKSTLLELALPGALFRSCPTRGSLADLATARDALVEARVVNGRAWTIRHAIDAANGKAEAVVLDDAGVSVLPSTKVRAFDEWAAAHLPAPSVLLASSFAPQGSGGFLAAKASERKAVLLRALGVEHLEGLAQRAREYLRAARAEVDGLEARLGDEQRRCGDPDQVAREVSALREAADGTAAAVAQARADLEDAQAAQAAHQIAAQAASAAKARRAELGSRRVARAAEVADAEQRIANNRAALADREGILAAAAGLEEARGELAAAQAEGAAAQRQRRDAEAEAARWQAQHRTASGQRDQVLARVSRLDLALDETAAIERAVDALPSARAELERSRVALDAAERAIDGARGERLSGAEWRLAGLRCGLDQIALGLGEARAVASAALADDDAAAREAEEAPRRLAALEASVAEWRAALRGAEAAVRELDTLAARAGRLEHDRAARTEALAEAARLEAAMGESRAAVGDAAERARAAGAAEAAAADRSQAAERQVARLAPLAARAAAAAHAEERIAELSARLEAARGEVAAIDEELVRVAAQPVPPAPDVESARRRVSIAEAADRSAAQAVASGEARLVAALESAAAAAVLTEKLSAARDEVADWARLAADLGRDGVQALEIDAAGPELTALANDLLHSCVGPRWTVSIETTRASADGKSQLEGCEVRVLDTERGRDAEASTFSGGERVILGEAVSLALTMLACRRSGLQGVTLVRDESGAALDPDNGRAYVAMLRRAADLVGASRVLFVSHSPEVVAMADAQIDVSAGGVS